MFVGTLTVCLGTGGSPDGLLVSASSLRMWSVLMYESYRPSPWRTEEEEEEEILGEITQQDRPDWNQLM